MNASVQHVGDWWPELTLPELLPDETLYSWASRYHRRSGNALARNTSLQLFGRPRGGTAHDLPCALDELTLRTQGLLGPAEDLAGQRTVLPFYLPARGPAAQAAAVAVLRGDGGLGSLKFQLGMLTSRFGAHHPLKACLHCAGEDHARYGEAYWHRALQWPGVWVCRDHGVRLVVAQVKRHGIHRFQWVLPETALLTNVATGEPPLLLFDLAAVIEGWCALPRGFAFDAARLASTYRQVLRQRGWTRGHSLNLAAVHAHYAQWSSTMGEVPELAPLMGTGSDAALVRVLRPARSGIHPLRHLAVITWLFGHWEAFCAAYCGEEIDTPIAEPAQSETPPRQAERRSTLVSLLRDDRFSLRQAALHVGVAVATAQQWATQAGLTVALRPKVLLRPLRQKIVMQLRRGKRQVDIAALCGVRVALVHAVLRSEIGLHWQWRAAMARHRAARARSIWAALRKRHPHASRKALRAKAPATFGWLYRNDRGWLAAHAPPLAKRRYDGQLRLDWNARDEMLVRAVTTAAEALRNKNGLRPIVLWQLCQRVPSLRPKLRYLDRLPRTEALLHRLRGVRLRGGPSRIRRQGQQLAA